MEFLACTKDGLIIYDALNVSPSDATGGWKAGKAASTRNAVNVVARIPSPDNAFGHAWSDDGELLASVCEEGVRIYEASKGYSTLLEVKRVSCDVDGRTGGVRKVVFSPKGSFIVAYEKWDPQYTENVHVWTTLGAEANTKLHSCCLKGYASGALPVSMIRWTEDERTCIELVPGTGLVLRQGDFSLDVDDARLVPEKGVSNFELSPMTRGVTFVSCFTPETEGGRLGSVRIFDLASPTRPVAETNLPAKVKDLKMLWNFDGSALLVLAASDVDETGCSYFGTTYLYWIKTDGKGQSQVFGAKDGQVQDIAWSPTANEFAAIVGFQPATVTLYSGKTGKLTSTWGTARRNTLKWNPFGRFVAVGGFGTLAGDLDFFDRSKEETISSLRAALTVDCAFGPDGRYFSTCTVAPRMNEGNQISMFKYNGDLLFKIDFVPEVIEARHEDTGAGARTKTQALLYATSWRPSPGAKYEDRAASPPPAGTRRKKGLPEAAAAAAAAGAPAYRPRGAGNDAGSSVAAMMRGEVPIPASGAWDVAPTLAPMEDWEIRKMERDAAKAAVLKEQQDKEAVIQARKDLTKSGKDDKKTLKALKEKLAELDTLKDKEWDELTSDDENQLEGEVDLRAQIVELEKRVDPDS